MLFLQKKMRFSGFIFSLILIMLFSCKNDVIHSDNQTKSDIFSTDTIQTSYNNTDTLAKYIVLDIIKELPFDYLPKPAQLYLTGTDNVDLILLNYNSVSFSYENNNNYTQAKIQYLKDQTNKDIVGVYFFEKSCNGFINHFYFFQKNNSKWSNVTQIIVNNSIINCIEHNLNTNLSYNNVNGFFAYSSEFSDKALLFDFSNNSKIYIFDQNTWSEVNSIIYSEGVLTIKETDLPTLHTKMLNSSQLDACKHFYNLDEALNDSQNVYIINFASIGLYSLNEKFTELKRIQVLILDDNYLVSISDKIFDLKKLQILRINNNSLEFLPDNIGYLNNLEEISVSNNKITNIPSSIVNAKNLKVLNLNNNLLSDINLNWENLENLIILNLSNNLITNLPASIGSINSLISLDISNNPISSLSNEIFNLTNLTYIDVSNTNISDDQIVELMSINAEITVIMD